MKLNKDETVMTIVILTLLFILLANNNLYKRKQQASYSPLPGVFSLAGTFKSQTPLPSPLWPPPLCHIPCQQTWGGPRAAGTVSWHCLSEPPQLPLGSSWPLLAFTSSARATEVRPFQPSRRQSTPCISPPPFALTGLKRDHPQWPPSHS